MKFDIVFRESNNEVAKIEGVRDVRRDAVSIEDMRRLLEAEALLERITGLRVWIQERS